MVSKEIISQLYVQNASNHLLNSVLILSLTYVTFLSVRQSYNLTYSGVAQLVERPAVNGLVTGSSPVSGAR